MKRYLLILVLVAGCNDRLPMVDQRTGQYDAFLGAIPADFKNTVDGPTFQAAAARAAAQLGSAAGALNLTRNEGFPLAPATTSADGLVELNGCSDLAAVSGGFLTRAQLDHMVSPGLSGIVGKSCDDALASAGVTFAGLMQGLTAQSLNLGRLELTSDACTTTRATPRHPAWAALGYYFTPAGDVMPRDNWNVPTALFEGGSDGQRVALRSEFDVAAAARQSDGSMLRATQWAGVGTLLDEASSITTSEKDETLRVRVIKDGRTVRDDFLTRVSNVSLHHGDHPEVTETTTYRAYPTNDATDHLWTVELHAQPGRAGGALDVDLAVSNDGGKPEKLALTLTPGATGGCLAAAR